MSGRTSANGPDPYTERLGKYWVGVRRRAWSIALVFTVLGEGIVIAATRTALPILATAPLMYLLMVFVLRLGARWGIASTGYRERDFAAEKEEPDLNRIGDVIGRREDLSVHRSRIFVFGGLLLGGILGMAVLLWSEGARDHVGPVSVGLIGVFFLGVTALFDLRLWRISDPSRVVGSIRDPDGWSSGAGVVSSLAWMYVGSSVVLVACGFGLALISNQIYWSIPFVLLALITSVLFWNRLGRCIAALSDSGS